jgi:hypothetical protein
VKISGSQAVCSEQLIDHAQRDRGMALARMRVACIDDAVAPQRCRAVFRRRIERKDVHREASRRF